MMPEGGSRWLVRGFGFGRAVHRALIWDGRRETALVVTTTQYGPLQHQSWTWQ